MSPKSKEAHVMKVGRGELVSATETTTGREIYRIEGLTQPYLLTLHTNMSMVNHR